jgi:hypothetical protein
MRDLYDRMDALTRQLAVIVTATEVGDDDEKIRATSIEIPGHVFDHVSQQMALTVAEWDLRTSFEPFDGAMYFNGIRIKRGTEFQS